VSQCVSPPLDRSAAGSGVAGENPLFHDNYGVSPLGRGLAGQSPRIQEPSAHAGDERELVASVLRKDRKAAARFVAGHIDAVYAYARHRLAPRSDLVDDVVQDVFLSALKGLAKFEGQSSLRTWLIAIARHKIEDIYRQRLRLPEAIEDLDPLEDESFSTGANTELDEQIDATRARVKVRNVLAQMPERYGLMLLWRYWEHRSAREVAVAIGTTEKSVERTLARARARFKELWLKE
jgi:RNA polymerase sigma-70 factor, ECF subfamily